MNVLIVAHPGGEILWLTPQSFDLILIAFLARAHNPYAKHCRIALAKHLFKEKINLLGS